MSIVVVTQSGRYIFSTLQNAPENALKNPVDGPAEHHVQHLPPDRPMGLQD